MDKKIWEQEYPKMPDSFHLAVKEAVERENETLVLNYKKAKRRHILLLAAVLMTGILAAAGVAAGKKDKNYMQQFVKRTGLEDTKDAADVLQKNVRVKAEETPVYKAGMDEKLIKSFNKRENSEPLLSVEGVMYDGMRLAVLALPTEEGKKYSCEAWEFRINGREIGPIVMDSNGQKEDFYIFSARVDSLNLETPFEVTIPLRNYRKGKRYENQDLTFTVEKGGEIQGLPEQKLVCEDYTLKVTELEKSVTALSGKIIIEMTKEQREAYESGNIKIVDVLFRKADGTIWHDSIKGEDWNDWQNGNGAYGKSRYSIKEVTEKKQTGDKNAPVPYLETFFYLQIPSDKPQSIILSLVGFSRENLEEPFDKNSLENRFGEDMVLALE